MPGRRIAYIDAMRGFTMILVVFSHVCNYCLGDKTMAWNDVFFLFRLPCFFFISGWLFYKADRQWNLATTKHVVANKFMVQIVPTFIFLFLLAPPPLFFSRLGALKGGYWFTFALFEFFVLYIFSARFLKRWGILFAVVISVAAFCYDVYYNRYSARLGWGADVLGFLSFMTWRYYLFFYIGTLVKQHFDAFIHVIEKPYVIIAVVGVFIAVTQIPHSDLVSLEYLIFAVGGVTGMTMVFVFFRFFAAQFAKERILGRALQYIGTRTLDIYLLHYFVLPRFLLPYGLQLQDYGSKLMEFLVVLLLALIVVSVCLLISYVIRLSPFLGHYLFGVNYQKGHES